MEEKTKQYPALPIDRDWAWFVMLGAFLNTLFHFMFLRSLSIFFIEFLDKFQQSATVTTMAFGLNTAAFILGAILLHPVFLSRFTVRSVTLLGSFITVASIIGLAFSPNMVCLTFMFVFIGFAHPLIFVSQVALLGEYFKNRLSFAVAFANLGLSGGLMIGPYLTRILLDEYGLRGSLLIHAGMNIHLFAACMLFRPTSLYSRPSCEIEWDIDSPELQNSPTKVAIESESDRHDTEVGMSRFDNERFDIVIQEIDTGSKGDDLEKSILIEEEDSNTKNTNTVVLSHPIINILQQYEGDNDSCSNSDNSLHRDSQSSLHVINDGGGRLRTVSEVCIKTKYNGETNPHTRSQMCIRSSAHSKLSLNTNNCNKPNSNSKQSRSIFDFMSSSKSVQYLSYSTIYLDKLFASLSTLKNGAITHDSQTFAEIDSQTSKMIVSDIIIDNGRTPCKKEYSKNSSNQNSCCSRRRDDPDLPPAASSTSSITASQSTKQISVCFHPLGIMLLLLAGIGVNTQCATAYMPSLGKDQGLSSDQLPVLMTVIGLVDLLKLATGYFADRGYVRRIHIVLVCQLFMGISCQFASYFQGFEAMIVLCVIVGLNTGVLHILLPGITVDVLGPEYIGQVMSGYFLINGANMTAVHILIGYLKDTTGTFAWGYNLVGCLVLSGALIILMEPLFRRCARS